MIEHMHWGFHAVLMFLAVLLVIGLGAALYLGIETILLGSYKRRLRRNRTIPGPVIRSANFDTMKKSRVGPFARSLR